ncbi:SurA N-terminal domain-containing protein [Bradyrhizobium sp. IC3069]|uniref:Parvulin-like PPIase n=1 Tax=Bradyrhizobium yuanmingense TaxID=108015 RepID=A0A1C3W714_9BRAD|nr:MULTISPECIES: SurA N-terminal domain-containing protein [Bradyrhizobium]MCA1362021.1 SurA N-terminal domain-containing protein [Bradyrhizobium sp. IC4059]MCA1520722.1 SurA N-terminal domain-containing protein [Bradyrhizobium sp. IC3069]TWI27404.1 peptidyl-prolyl cis-trans isomerase D [Bradyrhizobium yuanmingense]UWU88303.1 SurA N-terminal domain-containing protein [Bradyrhizobium sp. CB1024]SCB35882.1 peptidyl-prolyl cis-trans isomerase D [Bradyrhizobium yuanmingense]
MLRGIRKASSNWLGKIVMAVVMGVLIISFGIWGIADIFKGFGQSTVAKIGSTEISLNEFRQIYTDRLQQISRQFGRPLTPDQARAFGLDRQVLQQTIAEAALDEEARRLGLGQSDEQIRQLIMNDPNFKGIGGNFDPNRFQALIRNFGYTEQRYVAEQRKVSLRRQITGTVGAGLEPPKAMVDVLTRYQNEQRSIEFVRLDAAQAGPIDPPSPEALAAYFEDHKVQFRAPEYRKISFVVVSPEEIGKWTEVSDEDARKMFEQRKDRLGTPEKRQIQQIVFPNVAEAQAARERLVGGTSFEDIGKERGLSASDVDLGLVTKSSLAPAVGDAAFALPAGEISQPIQSGLGVAIVRVDKIEPGAEADYAKLAGDIKREIATERARVKVADLRDKMEDERGGGSSVIDAAQKLGLTAVTIEAVDRSGRAPNGQPVASIPQGLDVVSQAFNTDVGVDNDAISFKGGYVWYDVLAITPSRDRNLDEVRDQVEARWRQDQIAAKLKAKATEMVQKLDAGGKLADEATAVGAKVETASGFKRDDSPVGVPGTVVAAAFRTAKDGIGQTAVSGGSEVIVFRVTDIVDPAVDFASDAVKKLKESLDRAQTEEQVASYVNKLETDIGTTINQAAFAQVTGANQ